MTGHFERSTNKHLSHGQAGAQRSWFLFYCTESVTFGGRGILGRVLFSLIFTLFMFFLFIFFFALVEA